MVKRAPFTIDLIIRQTSIKYCFKAEPNYQIGFLKFCRYIISERDNLI